MVCFVIRVTYVFQMWVSWGSRSLKKPTISNIYCIHPGATKIYRDLREVYWWNEIKRDITDFVAECPKCQHVKVEHQKLGDVTQDISIATWKWEVIKMDFIISLLCTHSQKNDSIWVIVNTITLSQLTSWLSRLQLQWRIMLDSTWGSIFYYLISRSKLTSHF